MTRRSSMLAATLAALSRGRLEQGFLHVSCKQRRAEKLVAFSCRKRGFCPWRGVRRMAETAAMLADEVLPERPLRQWVLSLPHAHPHGNRGCDADSALRLGAEPERALSHAVRGRRTP